MQLRARSKSFLALRPHLAERPPLDDKENSPLSMRRKLKQSITNLASRLSPRDNLAKPLSPTSDIQIPKLSPSPPRNLQQRPVTAAGIKPSHPPVIPVKTPPMTPAEKPATPSQSRSPLTPRPQHASVGNTPSGAAARTVRTRTIVRIHNPDDIRAGGDTHPKIHGGPPHTSIPHSVHRTAAVAGIAESAVSTGTIWPSTPARPASTLTLMIDQLLRRLAAGETINYKLRNPPGYYDPDPECLHFMDDEEEEVRATPTQALMSTPSSTPTETRMRTPRTTPSRSRIPVPVKKNSKRK
ncbi:hypothetical protein TWF696_006503 [Orbilia brochopaga]|uniref:Uncharacterized protein n=1 Tax=Orbilia brochopaga TaxID=3140254 RepID=A0AAV9UZR3_9PEZI